MNTAFLKTLGFLVIVLLMFAPLASAQPLIHVKAAQGGTTASTASESFQDIPGLRVFFVAKETGDISICVSGIFKSVGPSMFSLRAVVDDIPASPEEVSFHGEANQAISFIFTSNVTAGLHEAKIQWSVEAGETAEVLQRTMWVAAAPDLINTIAAPSGPHILTASTTFESIPDMSSVFDMPFNGDAIITFSAIPDLGIGDPMEVQALVDGAVAPPAENLVFFVEDFSDRARAFTFVAPDLSSGEHNLDLQWRMANSRDDGWMTARTVTIMRSNPVDLAAGLGGALAVYSTDNIQTTSTTFVDVPGMGVMTPTPENASVVIGFQGKAAVEGDSILYVRALIDGVAANPGPIPFRAHATTQPSSFYFVAKNLTAGTHSVKMQWGSLNGEPVTMNDRTMTVIALPSQNHTANCWWFNSGEPGTGLSVEVQADRLFMAWYTYSQLTGNPEWHVAGGTMTDPFTFTGSLYRYTGWELGTAYVPPTPMPVGNVTVAFDRDDPDSGSITWNANGSIGTKTIQKFMPVFETGEQDPRGINGWWWDPAYNGMGVYMEARGQSIFIAWYQYREDGSPRWWSTGGAFAPGAPSFIGNLEERADGQWIGGLYQEPGQPEDRGQVAFVFNADGTASMTWNGQLYSLERFRF